MILRCVSTLKPSVKVGAALCALGLVAAPLAVLAQTPSAPPVTAPIGKSPGYEANVKALASVIGGLHSLKTTCDGGNDQTWRLNMQSLLDREGAPGAPLRVGMINAFNDGYQEQQSQHPACNAGAKAAQKNLGARGAQISRNLARDNY
ncbi:MAG: TIGR02301 family protein [Caulobacterales bacterium]